VTDGFFSCGVAPIGVSGPVFNQVDIMNRRVDGLLATTLDLADDLSHYSVANFSFAIDPAPVQSYVIRSIDDGVVFDIVDLGTDFVIPDIGAVSITPVPLPTDAPPTPPDAPTPNIPNAPSAYHPTFGPAYTPIFGPVPTYEDLTSGIPFPTPRPITLPAPPDVNFGIPFTATPPVFDAEPPDAADFDYTEQAYDPLLVSEIKTAIQSMLAGTSGLPRVVEDMLFARQAEREGEQADIAVQQARDDTATLGFTMPTGPLQSKLMQVRQKSQLQKNTFGRDVMIRVHEVLVDQFKFGVAQGIALENVWIGLYGDIQNRRLQAAQVAVNIAIAVYNARVAQYQAAAAVYKTEADVYAARIQAELAKLQGYAEQIRAQQLIGELNQQDIAIYTARLGAVETNVRVYLAEIEAYTSLANTEKVKLDAYRTTIDVEQSKLSASQLELQIWNGQVQGQGLIQQAYQTRAQVYLGNVQAWRAKYDAQIERQRGEIAALAAETERYTARVGAITAQANVQVAKGQLIISNNTAKLQKYTADAQWVSTYNTALAEKIRMINDANAQNTNLALKNSEINAQNGLAAVETEAHALQAGTQVLAQLTSSMASNVNMNMGVSDSTNFSQSCSYQTSQVFDS
jgi:hypothetical protein